MKVRTMTTELIRQQGGQLATGASAAYDNIDATLRFINEIGPVLWKSGAGGVKTESEGKLMALACLTERKNPFEINRTYHLMDGKLTMRADAMLAEFRARGGSFKWIKTGDDEQEAILHLEIDGDSIDSKYTFKQAEKAGLVRSGSGWTKNPANMLRARATSEGIRMIAPEIIAGTYTPEEIEDVATQAPPARTKAEVVNRGEELRQMQQEAQQAAKPANQDDEIIDAVVEQKRPAEPEKEEKVEPGPSNATEEPPFETTTVDTSKKVDSRAAREKAEAEGKIPDRWIIDMEIDVLLKNNGESRQQIEEGLNRLTQGQFTTIEALTDEKAYRLLQNLEKNRQPKK